MSYALLILFFFVEYVRPTSYVPALTVLKLNSLVPIGAFLASLASGAAAAAKERIGNDPSVKTVFGMLGLVFLSVLTTDIRDFAVDRLTALVGYAIVFWVLLSELTTIRRIEGLFATLVVVHLVIAALNPILFTDPENRNYIASGSFLGDGNDFSLSLDVQVPLGLFLFLNARARLKPLWLAALLVSVACVVLTQSRGGTLGLVAAAAYYWLRSPKKIQTGLLATVVAGLVVAMAPGAYFSRMNQIADTQEGSASARLMAWGVAIQMAADNPLLGVGAGNFPTKIGNEYRTDGVVGSGMNAHSVYFLALGELGLPGLVVVLYFIFSGLIANAHLSREARERHGPRSVDVQILASSSASMIAFAVAGAFLSALYYPHIYVMAGFQAAIRHVVRERLGRQTADAPVEKSGRQIALHPALRPRARAAILPAAHR